MRVQASELNGRVSSRRQTCASLQSGDWEAVVEPGNTQEARLSQLSRTDNASYRQGPVVGICFAISGALGSFFYMQTQHLEASMLGHCCGRKTNHRNRQQKKFGHCRANPAKLSYLVRTFPNQKSLLLTK